MDYPNNFNVPSFPAGKTIALARSVSVWLSIVFFLIVAVCGFIVLGGYYKTNYPFLVSIDSITDDWTTVAYPKEQDSDSYQQYEFIQEKLINDFVLNWFTISSDNQINSDRWAECSSDECSEPQQFNPENILCVLSCKSDSLVFHEFKTKVFPQYEALIRQQSETWRVIGKQFLPIIVSEDGGQWQVYTTIKTSSPSGLGRQFDTLTFIEIARDTKSYPATFGYYIKQFNSYRITQ